MNCLIIENAIGISFQFDELVENGLITLKQKTSGLELNYPLRKTNYFQIIHDFLPIIGNAEIEVVTNSKLLKRKKVKF